MSVEDAQLTRMVQREIAKRNVDITNLDVHVIRGVVYLRGVIRKIRGYDYDLKQELEIICRILRQKPGIRDVISEVTLR